VSHVRRIQAACVLRALPIEQQEWETDGDANEQRCGDDRDLLRVRQTVSLCSDGNEHDDGRDDDVPREKNAPTRLAKSSWMKREASSPFVANQGRNAARGSTAPRMASPR
jgi:hypothetical protein